MKNISALKGMLLFSFLLVILIPNTSYSQYLPPPYNFQAEIMSGNPDQVMMTWDLDPDTTLTFQFFVYIRDSLVLGSGTSQSWQVSLDAFNSHCYCVAAYYDQGTSEWAGPLCGPLYPAPYNVSAIFNNDIVPIVDIYWNHDADSVQYFIVERDGFQIGTTTGHYYTDFPPFFINYCYTVTAVYNTGNSAPAGPACTFPSTLLPEINVIPEWAEFEVPVSDSIEYTLSIINSGDYGLQYDFIGFTPYASTQGFITIDDLGIGWIDPYGGQKDIPIKWSSVSYPPGTYYQDLVIMSNDPDNPLEVIPNKMHVGPLSYLTGDIVKATGNEPLYGVEVTAGIQYDQTDTSGHYSFRVPANSTFDISYSKPGYEPLVFLVTTGSEGSSLIIDTSLIQFSNGLSWVISEVDCNDPAPAMISWSEPGQYDELLYDNDICTDLHFWDFAGGEHAVRFTPVGYPAIVNGGSFYVGSGVYPEGNWLNTSIKAIVYDVGPGGMPGNVLDSTIAIINDYGWVDCYFGYDAQIDTGDFFISIVQENHWPNTPPMGVDNYFSQDNYSFMKPSLGNWDTAGFRNFMIRATIDYPSTDEVDYYTIARIHDLDPDNGPQSGTHVPLGNVVGNQYTDDGFQYLNDGWYAYAVQTVYNNGQSDPYVYSNIIGHDIGNIVEFIAEDCYGNPIENLEVHMSGLLYPYELYNEIDTSPIVFDCVWEGSYDIHVIATGFDTVEINTDILADTSFLFMFDSTMYPATNLWVDTINMIAYWDAPQGPVYPTGYHMYLDGAFIGTTDTTFCIFTDLPFKQYTFCVEAYYDCGYADQVCTDFGGGYLHAPDWITGDSIGNDILLTWYYNDTLGYFDDAIIGFKLYRDSAYFKYIPYVMGQDTFTHLDTNLAPMCYDYHVAAFFDLETFGYPMQFGDSELTGPAEVCLLAGGTMPIFEDWSSGSFGSFWNSEGNWRVNGQYGNPMPSAEFTWDPVFEDYQFSLTSDFINGVYMDSVKQEYLDGKFILKFDLKLDDNSSSGTEYLKAEIWSEGIWNTVYTADNSNGSFDWTTDTIDITEYAMGYIFRLRIQAEGESTQNIAFWFVDNIELYHLCPDPVDLWIDTYYYPDAMLFWSPPDLNPLGDGSWIYWDDGLNINGIGLAGTGEFSVASRWDPDMIQQYNGMHITRIKFVPYANASASQFTLKVWKGPDAGTLLYEQTVDSYIAGEWNDYILNTPVELDVSQELWYGYTVNQPVGENPAGNDDGPAIAGYGDMITLDGSSWDAIGNYGPFDLNWNLRAYIQDISESGDKDFKNLQGYNIYYNYYQGGPFEFLDFTTDTFYFYDYNQGDLFCFYVTSVFGSCESIGSEEACYNIWQGVNSYSIETNIYPIPASNSIIINSSQIIQSLCLLDLSGRKLYCKENIHENQYSLNVSAYDPGVYLLQIDTEKGRAVKKIVIAR